MAQICSIRLYMVDKYIPNNVFAMKKFVNQPMYVLLHLTHFYIAVFGSLYLTNTLVLANFNAIYKGLPSWFC